MKTYNINTEKTFREYSRCAIFEEEDNMSDYSTSFNNSLNAFRIKDNKNSTKCSIELPIK